MKNKTFILLYSPEYQYLATSLPNFVMKIKIEKTVASIFRTTKVPVLIKYEGTREVDRVYGSINIKDKYENFSGV